MSKQYIKTEEGVSQVARPKIKVYKSIADLQEAIANGELKEGELVTTEFVDTGGDLSADVEVLANEIRLVNEKVDEKIDEEHDIILQLLDKLEPIGTIKTMGIDSGWDTEYWALCDGTNGTPDLRGATLKGVDVNYIMKIKNYYEEV